MRHSLFKPFFRYGGGISFGLEKLSGASLAAAAVTQSEVEGRLEAAVAAAQSLNDPPLAGFD